MRCTLWWSCPSARVCPWLCFVLLFSVLFLWRGECECECCCQLAVILGLVESESSVVSVVSYIFVSSFPRSSFFYKKKLFQQNIFSQNCKKSLWTAVSRSNSKNIAKKKKKLQVKSEIKFSKLKQILANKKKLTVSNKIKNTERGRNCKKVCQGKGFSERKKYSEMCRELVPIGQFIYL